MHVSIVSQSLSVVSSFAAVQVNLLQLLCNRVEFAVSTKSSNRIIFASLLQMISSKVPPRPGVHAI